MKNPRILVPVDFTPASANAIKLAAITAVKGKLEITLLHVADKKDFSVSEVKLKDLCHQVSGEYAIRVNPVIAHGSIFTEIPREACDDCYRLMIIGSHGYKGFREKFLGSDILKLLKKIPLPVVVVQRDFVIPPEGIRTIVFPPGTHKTFPALIEATALVAGIFDAEVHLYTVEKLGLEWSDALKYNLELARKQFEENKIRVKRVNEPQTTFDLGYSKQILRYAKSHQADLIAVMSIPTPEHYYFADADKELLLTNDDCIPILSSSGKKSI